VYVVSIALHKENSTNKTFLKRKVIQYSELYRIKRVT